MLSDLASMTLKEIIEKAADGQLNSEQVEDFCSAAGMAFSVFCDEFARVIATEYSDGRFAYTFCDSAMNALFAFTTNRIVDHPSKDFLPDYSYSVYLAFDEGEYRHRNDPPNVSSEELYTKPMIARIISKAPNG
jgi:hypothetical protein